MATMPEFLRLARPKHPKDSEPVLKFPLTAPSCVDCKFISKGSSFRSGLGGVRRCGHDNAKHKTEGWAMLCSDMRGSNEEGACGINGVLFVKKELSNIPPAPPRPLELPAFPKSEVVSERYDPHKR